MASKKKAEWPEEPEEGFCYIPPKSWRLPNRYPKGEQGYIDSEGCEWCKGPNHRFPNEIDQHGQPYEFEWDVQLPNGKHWNISPSKGPTDPYGRNQQ